MRGSSIVLAISVMQLRRLTTTKTMAFVMPSATRISCASCSASSVKFQRNPRLYFSSKPTQITQIGKEQMEEILEDMENAGREETGYVVIDVRNPDEIAITGHLSPNVVNLPLPLIMQSGALQIDEEEFQESFGFAKPGFDETLVFTCKAGMRSMYAAQVAASLGYENIVNYRGGADEWFSGRF